MKIILYILIILCFFYVNVSANQPSVSVGVEQRGETGQDKNLSNKKKFEQMLSETKEKAVRTAKSLDKNTAEAIQKKNQNMRNSAVDISIPLYDLFFPFLAKEEFFQDRFKIPADFGLTANQGNGWVDSNLAKWLEENKYADILDVVSQDDQDKLHKYIENCLYYGLLIGQAFLYLCDDISDITITDKDEKTGIIKAQISFSDLKILAEGAYNRAKKGITNDYILHLRKNARYKTNCRLAGSTDKIFCGNCTVILAPNTPQLDIDQIHVFGNAYSGMSGKFSVSAGLSWVKALSDTLTTTEGVNLVKSVNKSSSNLLSQGMTKEAVLLQKMAWESINSGRSGVGISTPGG